MAEAEHACRSPRPDASRSPDHNLVPHNPADRIGVGKSALPPQWLLVQFRASDEEETRYSAPVPRPKRKTSRRFPPYIRAAASADQNRRHPNVWQAPGAFAYETRPT